MSKRKLIVFAVLLFSISFIQSCANSINLTTEENQRAEDFTDSSILDEGLALLPISGDNQVFKQAVASGADSTTGSYTDNYLSFQETSERLNDNNLVSTYQEAIEGYNDSGLMSKSNIQEIGAGVDKRYLLKIELASMDVDSETQTSSLDGETYTAKNKSLRLSGTVWDSETGEKVWEATSRAGAYSGDLTHIKATDEDFYRKAAEGLVQQLFDQRRSDQ